MSSIFAVILVLVLVVFYLAIIGLGIASYVVNAIGLSRVAEKKGVKNPWLAWIPVANLWVTGSIADGIDARQGRRRNWGKTLLWLYAAVFAAIVIFYIGLIVLIILSEFGGSDYDATLIGFFIFMYAAIFALAFVGMVAQAFYYICLYKIFEDIAPEKSVKYFVLSILIPMAMGFCLMRCCPEGSEVQQSTEIQS